jgi:hypothetical protein
MGARLSRREAPAENSPARERGVEDAQSAEGAAPGSGDPMESLSVAPCGYRKRRSWFGDLFD